MKILRIYNCTSNVRRFEISYFKNTNGQNTNNNNIHTNLVHSYYLYLLARRRIVKSCQFYNHTYYILHLANCFSSLSFLWDIRNRIVVEMVEMLKCDLQNEPNEIIKKTRCARLNLLLREFFTAVETTSMRFKLPNYSE